MPVTSIFWPDNAAQDVHLLPGFVGPRLDHLLWIGHTAGNVRADSLPASAALSFAANFAAGPGTAGVAVSAANGEVTVTGPLPAPNRLLEFIVTATVQEGASTFTAHKRFHIHSGITRMWLTPATLTVRRNARNVRFTVLAEFADGTYGDLTTWCPWDPPAAADRSYVRASGSNDPAIAWTTSAAATVGVNAATGRLTGAATAGNASITAAVQPLPAPANQTATGTARAARAWSDPVTLALVDGPGFGAMGRAVNILILPDGFRAAERADFERLARQLVQRLRTRRLTRPFDLLSREMNYFIAWVESREGGISPLPEVRRFNVVGTRADASEVGTSVADAAVPGAWRVAAPPVPATNDRYLLNERDTAFHVVLGERPRATQFHVLRSAYFHRSRFDEQDLDDFLGALRNTGGAAVGGIWARGGKDQEKIVVLARSERNGGSNNFRSGSGRYICMTLDRATEHQIEDAAANLGKDLRPDPIPAAVHIEVWTTAAHELAHSFLLRDEYGGGGPLPASQIAELTGSHNTDARSNLLTGGNLDADRIKWRWPRLGKAGLLTGQPVPLGGNRFSVPMQAGHGMLFVVGDVVRFRTRALLAAGAPSNRFIVVTRAANPEVEALTAGPFNPASFPAGSLLISPIRAPDPDAPNRVFGDDLEMVHQNTRARINATRNPLNAADGDPANRPCTGAALPTPTGSTNWPGGAAPNPPIYSSWVVGLYENARGFDCDAYRPTGVCIMRTLHYHDIASGTDRAYQFCPVCRYAIVDLLDPTKHGAIDADYAPRYPV